MSPGLLRVVRRVVVAPLVVLLGVAVWSGLPLWLLGAAAASPWVPGRWRAPRLLWMFVLYLTLEALLLPTLLGLWLASGFGRRIRSPYFEGIHYELVQAVTWVLFREAKRVVHLEIATQGPTPDAFPGRQLIVACRHAGPADSFMLIHALMHTYHREPRVVLKQTLAWDPVIDVLLNRIPAQFIAGGDDVVDQIGALAADLDGDDAFVIFPEGGNFTTGRRAKQIDRLRAGGHGAMADRAEGMRHVLAPRPGGLLAALDAAPEADVVMVAHTGLDHVDSARDLWRELPMDKRIIMRWWRIPRGEIPADRPGRIDWLYGWWERIDAWVAEHRPVDLPPSRLAAAAAGSPAADRSAD